VSIHLPPPQLNLENQRVETMGLLPAAMVTAMSQKKDGTLFGEKKSKVPMRCKECSGLPRPAPSPTSPPPLPPLVSGGAAQGTHGHAARRRNEGLSVILCLLRVPLSVRVAPGLCTVFAPTHPDHPPYHPVQAALAAAGMAFIDPEDDNVNEEEEKLLRLIKSVRCASVLYIPYRAVCTLLATAAGNVQPPPRTTLPTRARCSALNKFAKKLQRREAAKGGVDGGALGLPPVRPQNYHVSPPKVVVTPVPCPPPPRNPSRESATREGDRTYGVVI